MIKKIALASAVTIISVFITSCEEDFTEVNSGINENNKFTTKEITLPISISEIDTISQVRADNIQNPINTYLLGVYKPEYYKGIEASIVGELAYKKGLKTKQSSTDDTQYKDVTRNIDSTFTLDHVILRIPYTVSKSTKNTNGTTTFRLDSILGDVNAKTSIQVYQNETYLHRLNPENPSRSYVYNSKFPYQEGANITAKTDFSFKPSPQDTVHVYKRLVTDNTSSFEKDFSFKITSSKDTLKAIQPFLAIPLKVSEMKKIFWDKFGEPEFESSEAFKKHFKGIIIKAKGNNGSLIPLDLNKNAIQMDFFYTIHRKENGAFLDNKFKIYSYKLSGIRNSIYKMSTSKSNTPNNTFRIQGTSGITGNVSILDNNTLDEIRSKNLLINKASLTFFVDNTINTDKKTVPNRIFIYKNATDKFGKVIPVHLSDSYTIQSNNKIRLNTSIFNGFLNLSSDNHPEKYTLDITNYFSNLLTGKEKLTPLTLKSFNFNTDFPIAGKSLDTIVKSYNWNPRGVTLFNGNNANGNKKAVLKILYSETKTK